MAAMIRKLLDDDAPILTLNGPPVSGTSGSYATYPVGKGALLLDISSGVLYINTGSVGSPAWSEIPNHSSGPGLGLMRTAVGSFDVNIDNVSTGTHPFVDRTPEQNPIAIPAGGVAVFGIIETTVALTGNGGTSDIGLALNSNVVQASVNEGLVPWTLGFHNTSAISTWLSPSYLKMTNGLLEYNIGGFPLLTGQFDVHYLYFTEA